MSGPWFNVVMAEHQRYIGVHHSVAHMAQQKDAFVLLNTYVPESGRCFLCSGVVVSEKTPLVIFGMAKVRRVRISALLSGLKLEADLENGQASATYRQKVRGGRL